MDEETTDDGYVNLNVYTLVEIECAIRRSWHVLDFLTEEYRTTVKSVFSSIVLSESLGAVVLKGRAQHEESGLDREHYIAVIGKTLIDLVYDQFLVPASLLMKEIVKNEDVLNELDLYDLYDKFITEYDKQLHELLVEGEEKEDVDNDSSKGSS